MLCPLPPSTGLTAISPLAVLFQLLTTTSAWGETMNLRNNHPPQLALCQGELSCVP